MHNLLPRATSKLSQSCSIPKYNLNHQPELRFESKAYSFASSCGQKAYVWKLWTIKRMLQELHPTTRNQLRALHNDKP